MPAASGSQKRESDPPGTGVMKHLMDARDQTWVLCKSKKCWTISLTPTHFHVLLSSINQADGFISCMAAHQGGNTTHLHGSFMDTGLENWVHRPGQHVFYEDRREWRLITLSSSKFLLESTKGCYQMQKKVDI